MWLCTTMNMSLISQLYGLRVDSAEGHVAKRAEFASCVISTMEPNFIPNPKIVRNLITTTNEVHDLADL